MINTWWWVSGSSSKAPRRCSQRSLTSSAESGAREPTRRLRSEGRNDSSPSIETSWARLLRPHEPVPRVPQRLVAVNRDFLGPARAPVRVDRRVAGDLVDPRLEGDRRVRGTHPPQGREERLLGYVLGARVVSQLAAHERGDAWTVAAVELLERGVVARADPFHQGRVIERRRRGAGWSKASRLKSADTCCPHCFPITPCRGPGEPLALYPPTEHLNPIPDMP